eukprot:1374140-Rhodomonas_salina.1
MLLRTRHAMSGPEISYPAVNGSSACVDCVADTYSPTTAAVSPATCLDCPSEFSQSVPGSDGANDCNCNSGYTGSNGGDCRECVPGKYKPSIGSAACTLCPTETYSTTDAATSAGVCESCPLYTVSLAGSNNLTDCVCALGYTGPDGLECTPCVAGTYKDVIGSSLCLSCPADSTSLSASDALSDCLCNAGFEGSGPAGCEPCSTGRYKVDWSGDSCLLCPAGSYHGLTTQTSPDACMLCPIASNSPAGSSTILACTCNAGYFGSDGTNCSGCAAGKYKEAPGDQACALCPEGTFSAVEASDTSGSCELCAAFSFSGAGASAAANCSCIPGYTRGAGDCEPC